jgi:hypothetical protein
VFKVSVAEHYCQLLSRKKQHEQQKASSAKASLFSLDARRQRRRKRTKATKSWQRLMSHKKFLFALIVLVSLEKVRSAIISSADYDIMHTNTPITCTAQSAHTYGATLSNQPKETKKKMKLMQNCGA